MTTCVFHFASLKFHVALFGCFRKNLFALFRHKCFFQSVAGGTPHVVHAYRSDSFQTGICLGCTDGKTSAAANADSPDTFTVDKSSCSQKINSGAERFRVHVGRNRITYFSTAFSPISKVYGKGYEPPFRHFRSIEVSTLLYRVTPAFTGTELVARGVEMEAYSVEDQGRGVCFHVYCYNVQPGVEIDYATGENWEA